jgi:hypothetical protein
VSKLISTRWCCACSAKGHRVRLVPISVEGRKALFKWLSRSDTGRYVLGTKQGRPWSRRNAYRDLTILCRQLGITGARVNPHAFRHCFAVSYIRNGGDLYRLSRILGHASISTTQLYLRSMGLEHLQEGHAKFSPLGNLARSASLIVVMALASLGVGCSDERSALGPDRASGCRSDVVVAVSPAEHRVSWVLPSGVIADAIQVRTTDPSGERTSTITGAVTAVTVDPNAVAVSVRARVCGRWGEWVSVSLR